jgi:uncharacterized membrane protein YcfT
VRIDLLLSSADSLGLGGWGRCADRLRNFRRSIVVVGSLSKGFCVTLGGAAMGFLGFLGENMLD